MNTLYNYVTRLNKMLGGIDRKELDALIECLWSAYLTGNTVYVIGNGGSATTASHMAVDLSKCTVCGNKPRMDVVSLADHVSNITAIANDYSYEDIFVEQLKNRFKRGDVLLGLSVSGNSPNLVKAFQWCSDNGHMSAALCGRDGGKLYIMASVGVLFPDKDYGPVEDGHLILTHVLTEFFTNRIKQL